MDTKLQSKLEQSRMSDDEKFYTELGVLAVTSFLIAALAAEL